MYIYMYMLDRLAHTNFHALACSGMRALTINQTIVMSMGDLSLVVRSMVVELCVHDGASADTTALLSVS